VFEKILNSSAEIVGEDSMQPFVRQGNIIQMWRLKFNEETRYEKRLLFAVRILSV
jgi:hypothetical protein